MTTFPQQPLELPPMADVVEIRSLDDLQPYRLAWRELLDQTPDVSFFKTFDWLEAAWQHDENQELRVLVIRSHKKPIGFVPLCVVHEDYTVGTVRTLTFPLADWGSFYSPIGPNQTACYWLAMQHLADGPRDWDLLDLRWIHSEAADTVQAVMGATGLSSTERDYQKMSILKIRSTWDEYLATRSKKIRHEIRRRTRIDQRFENVEFIRHRPQEAAKGDGAPRWDLLVQCQEIAAASWQARATDGNTLTNPSVKTLLEHAHEAAARRGMLDLALLKIDGRPAAFAYNYHYRGNLYGLRMGYHPDFAKAGAGASLLALTLRDSFERGDRELNLGAGDYAFKREYRTNVITSRQLTHYPTATWRAQGIRLTRWLKSRNQLAASL